MFVSIKCCLCGKDQRLVMTPQQYDGYTRNESVEYIMADAHVMVKETLITRMCFDCQSKMYNMPKPGEDWGKRLKDCDVCGAALWAKDISGVNIKCRSCGNIRKEVL